MESSTSSTPSAGVDFAALRDTPYALLAAMDLRMQAVAGEVGATAAQQAWEGLEFRLAGQRYLAPQQEVREVIVPPPHTRVPNARDWLLGVANVRGNLLPLIDLGRLLGGEQSTIRRESRFMVLNSDEIPAGFLVDAVSGYRRFTPQEQQHGLVAGQSDDSRPFLLGAFSRDEEAWVVFSLQKLVRSDLFRNASRQ